jgi:hypothetical protein
MEPFKDRLKIIEYNINRSSYNIGVRLGEWSLLGMIDDLIPTLRALPEFPPLVEKYLGGSLAIGAMGAHKGRMAQVHYKDNLRTLAARELGSKNRYKELWEINKDWLKDPSQLQAGMFIRLPDVETK